MKKKTVKVDKLKDAYFTLKEGFAKLEESLEIKRSEHDVMFLDLSNPCCSIFFTGFELDYSENTDEFHINLMFSNELIAEFTIEKGCIFDFDFDECSIMLTKET